MRTGNMSCFARSATQSSPDAVRELLVNIDSSSSGAILQVHIHSHPHSFTDQGIHQAHPGIG